MSVFGSSSASESSLPLPPLCIRDENSFEHETAAAATAFELRFRFAECAVVGPAFGPAFPTPAAGAGATATASGPATAESTKFKSGGAGPLRGTNADGEGANKNVGPASVEFGFPFVVTAMGEAEPKSPKAEAVGPAGRENGSV